MTRGLALAAAAVVATLAGAARADGPVTVTTRAPIVAGNAAGAKQKALGEAWRLGVEQVFARALSEAGVADPAPPLLAEFRAELAKNPRRFVRGYRLLEQGDKDGDVVVAMEVDVDEGALRREIERVRVAAAPRPGEAVVLVLRTSNAPLYGNVATALSVAFAKAGVKTQPWFLADPPDAEVLEQARKVGARAAVVFVASSSADGPVRGTGVRGVRCQVTLRLVSPAGGALGERAASDWAFAVSDEAAGEDCLRRAAAAAVDAVAADLPALAGLAGTRVVQVALNVPEAVALSHVLHAVHRIASVSASEVRRVAGMRVDLRVVTRLDGPALLAALVRELGAAATVKAIETQADRLTLDVRAVTAAAVPPALVPAAGAVP